jgi:hypothetical protein
MSSPKKSIKSHTFPTTEDRADVVKDAQDEERKGLLSLRRTGLPLIPLVPGGWKCFRLSYETAEEYDEKKRQVRDLVLQKHGPAKRLCGECYDKFIADWQTKKIPENNDAFPAEEDQKEDEQLIDIYIMSSGMPMEDVWTNTEVDEMLRRTVCFKCQRKFKLRIVHVKKAFLRVFMKIPC